MRLVSTWMRHLNNVTRYQLSTGINRVLFFTYEWMLKCTRYLQKNEDLTNKVIRE